MRFALLLGLLCLAPGCVLHARGYYPRPAPRPVPAPAPAPAPPPRVMSYDEAVSLGLGQCRSRGYRCELKEAHRKGRDVWKVKFRAFARGARGHLHLEYDAYSRALLEVDEKVKDRGDDWEDDDDGRGHGRGKKKGHAKWDD